jgi:hypothetical protein
MFKKWLIAIVLVGGVGLVGFAGLVFFLGKQATNLPDWYQPNSTNNVPPSAEPMVVSNTPTETVLKLTDAQLNQLVSEQLFKTGKNQSLPTGIKGINTKINDGKLTAGAILNLGELSRQKESSTIATTADKITSKLPYLNNQEVYLGISGKPLIKDNQIQLDRNSQIQIGNLNLSVNQTAQLLGTSEEQLIRSFNLRLPEKLKNLESIDIEGNRAVIKLNK